MKRARQVNIDSLLVPMYREGNVYVRVPSDN